MGDKSSNDCVDRKACKATPTPISCVISSSASSSRPVALTADEAVSKQQQLHTSSSTPTSPPMTSGSSCQEFALLITELSAIPSAASRCSIQTKTTIAPNNSVISSCHLLKASPRSNSTADHSLSTGDTDSSATCVTTSDPDPHVDLNSSHAAPDVTRISDKCVTDFANNRLSVSNTPVARKPLPRITVMSATSQVRPDHRNAARNFSSQENSDVEDVAHDDGIFSADRSPADSSDEVTICRMSGASGISGLNQSGNWKQLRPVITSNMDIGSDDDRDLDDGYDFGCSRTDGSEEEDEVDDELAHSADGEDEQRQSSRMLINDDDSMMSSSISSNSNYGSCSSISFCPDVSQLSNVVINGKQMDMTSDKYAVLSFDQVGRLDHVMDSLMPIHGRGNFPTLEVKLKDLVQVVRSKLVSDGVAVRDIRLNGGAASYVISCLDEKQERSYSDLDLIFTVDLSNHHNFDKVRSAVLDSLLDFLPEGVNKKKMSSCTLKEAYVHKMVKVAEAGDRWSLISLCNNSGRDIEIKFVDTMKRQFEFSVDSFQIILDSLLLYYECSDSMSMTENIFPTVVGESVYGNFSEALHHLQHRMIATRNPEEIRGGGLLKYCRLQVLGYQAENIDEMKNMEKYMCSRFFIDFSDISVQRVKLANYLNTHFHDDQMKYDYLMILQQVVDESTVCLMGHERRQTLCLIEEFALHFYFQDPHRQLPHRVIPPPYQQQPDHHHQQQHHRQQPHKTQDHPHYNRRHANKYMSEGAGHPGNLSKKSQQQHSSTTQQQPVSSHTQAHPGSGMQHRQQPQHQQHPQQQQAAQQQNQIQTQTLLLGSGGQFYYTPTAAFHSNNVTYQTYQTAITQSNPTVPQHPHYHHHHHHHCHSHLPPQTHHQNFGCFNCCGGGSGPCGITWMPCA